MNMLSQPNPVETGKGKVIGELIDTDSNPIDALKTIHNQIEKMREWNLEAALDAIGQADDRVKGAMLTCETVEMQMQAILSSPLLKAAPELFAALDRLVTRFDVVCLAGYVGSDYFRQAHEALKKARGQ